MEATLGNIGVGKDCEHDLDNAKHVSRAIWICPLCGEDISLLYLFWLEAQEDGDEHASQIKKLMGEK